MKSHENSGISVDGYQNRRIKRPKTEGEPCRKKLTENNVNGRVKKPTKSKQKTAARKPIFQSANTQTQDVNISSVKNRMYSVTK